MTEQDKREVKALALLDYAESKQEIALLTAKLADIGKTFQAVAEDLINSPAVYRAKGYRLPSQADIDVLVDNLKKACEKSEQLRKQAAALGVPGL